MCFCKLNHLVYIILFLRKKKTIESQLTINNYNSQPNRDDL